MPEAHDFLMVRSLRTIPRVLLSALNGFIEHDVMTLGAGLAFYTMLSLAPLLVLLVLATSHTGVALQQQLIHELVKLAGPEAGGAIQLVLNSAVKYRSTGVVSSLIGLVGVLLSATVAFGHLHRSLNIIWEVRGKTRSIVGGWFRGKAVSLVLMAGLAGLVLFSIGANTVLNLLPAGTGVIAKLRDFGGSFLIYALLFGLIFRLVPDTKVLWRDALLGACFTAALFLFGNWAIVKYFHVAGAGSAYGAAGSLFVFLVYVYYISVIVFFGAELTQAWGKRMKDEG